MRRLRDQTSSPDRATARAAALLSGMAQLDGDRLTRRPLPAADVGPHRAAGRFRSALVLTMTLASAGAAAATLHRAGWLHVPPSPAAPAATPAAAEGRGPVAPELPPSPAPPVVAERIDPPVVAPVAPARASVGTRSRISAPSHPVSGDTARRAQGAGDDESMLIMEGVRALRRDGDPSRSEALAEGALQRYPHGALAEEAMALAMEAASARGDVPASRRAAQRYLDNFRSGRFADRAQRILVSPPR
jgi:hypothetical protein